MLNVWDIIESFLYRITTPLAVTTNTTLVYLILHHSPKSLGTYKYLMVGICLFEVIYEILDLAVTPDIYTQGSALFLVVLETKTVFPVSMVSGVNLACCGCFGASLGMFAIHFVYRYLVVSGRQEWTIKSTRNLAAWLTAPMVFGAVWIGSTYIFMTPTQLSNRALREEMMGRYGLAIENLYYVGPFYYPPDKNGKPTVNWKTVHGMTVLIFMTSVSLFTMAFFGVKSYLKINNAVPGSRKSSKFKSLQTQLLLALILQTIIPLVLMHIPGGICFILPIFLEANEVLGHVLTVSISLYPILDPLPNMFLIKDYRRALFGAASYSSEVPKEDRRLYYLHDLT